MDQAVRNLVRLGASLEDAIHAATTVPAHLAGRRDLGILRLGGPADIVVLDDDLNVTRTLIAGREAFSG